MNTLLMTAAALTATALTMTHGLGTLAAKDGAPEKPWEIRLTLDRSQLKTQEGLEQVHAIIMRKATALCREPGRRDLQSRAQERQCRDEITMKVALAIDSEPLVLLARSRQESTPSTDAS